MKPLEHIQAIGGQIFLPFARNIARKLRAVGLAYAVQTHEIEGVRISVRIMPGHDHISLIKVNGRYEFHCSDPGASFGTIGAIHNCFAFTDDASLMNAWVRGCGVGRVAGRSRPLFSNYLQPPADGSVTWKMLPVPVGPLSGGLQDNINFETGGADQRYGTMWQDQRLTEYQWWYNNTNEALVTSCLAFGKGLSYTPRLTWFGITCCNTNGTAFDMLPLGIHEIVLSMGCTPGSMTWFTQYTDYFATASGYSNERTLGNHEMPGMWDVPLSLFSYSLKAAAAYKRTPYANWRRGAVQKIKVGAAYHWYAIMSDTHGGFCAYHVRDYGASAFDIPAGVVKTAMPAYPSWVTQPAADTYTTEQWLFQFNKDGTKASTTPFEKVETWVWVGAENINAFPTASPSSSWWPRSTLFGEATKEFGSGWNGAAFCYGSRQNGMIWPLESSWTGAFGGVNYAACYTVTRQRVYVSKYSEFTPSSAVYIQGRLCDISNGRLNDYANGADKNALWPELDIADYEPAFTQKPGFLELGFTITPGLSGDPDDFTFTVDVLQQESYETNKRFYVDAGYFAYDKRIAKRAKDMGLADDTLLTAEIEVFVKDPTKVVGVPPEAHLVTNTAPPSYSATQYWGNFFAWGSPTDWTGYNGGVDAMMANAGFTGTYNYTLRNEPNAEGALICRYDGDVEIHYVVRQRESQQEVVRFNLGHNIHRRGNDLSCVKQTWNSRSYGVEAGYHIGAIGYADLAKLNFLTCSRSHRSDLFRAGSSRAGFLYTQPRWELRIFGENVETINYAEEGIHGYDEVADPIVEYGVIPAGYTKLPDAASPDGFLLSTQLWAVSSLFQLDITRYVSWHPDGHWAAYIDVHGAGRTYNANYSTVKGEVFDFIKPFKGVETTHKASFNTAFKQERSYADYQVDPREMGGFATFGGWTYFNKTPTHPVWS